MKKTWLLALESSTPHGGAALIGDGEIVATRRLDEGLRHGRELMPAAASLLAAHSLTAADMSAIAVSIGPGSYTGIRVGVMSAKAFAYAAQCSLAAVSSLAAMALTARIENRAVEGGIVCVAQNARRDEVYAAAYQLHADSLTPIVADMAVTPEEARDMVLACAHKSGRVVMAGSAFTAYASVFAIAGAEDALAGAVHPGAVGLLAWRQFMQGKCADPMQIQPVYLRRDSGTDWKHDILISQAK